MKNDELNELWETLSSIEIEGAEFILQENENNLSQQDIQKLLEKVEKMPKGKQKEQLNLLLFTKKETMRFKHPEMSPVKDTSITEKFKSAVITNDIGLLYAILPDVDDPHIELNASGVSPLQYAIEEANTDLVKILLTSPHIAKNIDLNKYLNTGLCGRYSDIRNAFSFLMIMNIDFLTLFKEKWSFFTFWAAVTAAMVEKNKTLASQLVIQNPELCITVFNKTFSNYILCAAVNGNHWDLVDKMTIEFDDDEVRYSALLALAIQNQQYHIVNRFLKKGFPLKWISFESAKLINQHGADSTMDILDPLIPTIEDKYHRNHYAIYFKFPTRLIDLITCPLSKTPFLTVDNCSDPVIVPSGQTFSYTALISQEGVDYVDDAYKNKLLLRFIITALERGLFSEKTKKVLKSAETGKYFVNPVVRSDGETYEKQDDEPALTSYPNNAIKAIIDEIYLVHEVKNQVKEKLLFEADPLAYAFNQTLPYLQTSATSALSQTCKKYHVLFTPSLKEKLASDLLRYVLSGKDPEAKALYSKKPELLFTTATVKTHLEGSYHDLTPIPQTVTLTPIRAMAASANTTLLKNVIGVIQHYVDPVSGITGVALMLKQIRKQFPMGFDFPRSVYQYKPLVTSLYNQKNEKDFYPVSDELETIVSAFRMNFRPKATFNADTTGYFYNVNELIAALTVFTNTFSSFHAEQQFILHRYVISYHVRLFTGLLTQILPDLGHYRGKSCLDSLKQGYGNRYFPYEIEKISKLISQYQQNIQYEMTMIFKELNLLNQKVENELQSPFFK